ncbi:MAG TPA: VOC family protein [Allosphingosinicella sp.]|jgi:catechol 2,3-dioxygenase-like lactoylglutathione lyase family enzyme
MARVTGLGGVFYKVADTEATARWYREVLGLGGEWGITFPWKVESGGEAYSLLSAFKADSDYFAPSAERFMVNLRVDDLEGMIADLEAKGVEILGRQDEDYGNFAWILDCDGVKLELWEQKGAAPE